MIASGGQVQVQPWSLVLLRCTAPECEALNR